MKRLAATAVVALWSPAAYAWESECRRDPSTGHDHVAMANAVCTVEEDCADYAFARGTLVGEHALLALWSMEWAGLSALVGETATDFYYTDGSTIPGAPFPMDTREPAWPGKMTQLRVATTTIPQLSHVPDGSYSLSDFLSGNEHCLPPQYPAPDYAANVACHTYKSHLAPVNSSHFAPQSRSMYALYHGIALSVAARCKTMHAGFSAGTHPLTDEARRKVTACEREAYSFQAVASHYAADAWSTGHMWQRFGSPNASAGVENRMRNLVVGAVSGLIHGWRSLARENATIVAAGFEHDQLCMPGSFARHPDAQIDDHRDEMVEWTYPPAAAAEAELQLGGGDVYLLACSTPDERFAVAPPINPRGRDDTTRILSPQYRRMMTCLALGWEEVHAAGAGAARGPISRNVPYDAGITGGSLDPLCFEMRVTNRSFLLGTHVSSAVSLFDAALVGNVVIRIGESVVPPSPVVQTLLELLPRNNDKLRIDLIKFGHLVRRRARQAPDATDLADLHRDGTVSILGVLPNGDYEFLIKDGAVAYLERADPTTWDPTPLATCTRDDDCAVAGVAEDDATYCDTTAAGGPRCVRHETALLKYFRDAEAPKWCAAETDVQFDAARAACAATGNATSTACQTCTKVVLPHLRNSCDAGTYPATGMAGGKDLRSICDIYQAAGLIPASVDLDDNALYTAYGTQGTAAEAAAATLCLGSKLPSRCGASFVEGPTCAQLPDLLAVGGRHVFFRTCDDCLQGSGIDQFGALGQGALRPFLTESAVRPSPGFREAVAMTAGATHACGLLQGGNAICAGDNFYGALGVGTIGGPQRDTPTTVALAGIARIVAGDFTTCAITDTARLFCWGSNRNSQVGNATAMDTGVPVEVLTGVVDVSIGGNLTCAVKTDTTLWCWGTGPGAGVHTGFPFPPQVLTPGQVVIDVNASPRVPVTGAVEVDVSGPQACIRTTSGGVACWSSGTILFGDGPVAYDGTVRTIPGAANVVDLEGGAGVICARTSGGAVQCWGPGPIGNGTMDPADVAVTIAASGVTALASGPSTCMQRSDGSIACWGRDLPSADNLSTQTYLSPTQFRGACP